MNNILRVIEITKAEVPVLAKTLQKSKYTIKIEILKKIQKG